MTAALQLSMPVHVAGFAPVPLAQANLLLAEWGHYLGPVQRPFGSQAWLLDVAGEPVSVAVSCSIVSPTVGEYRRDEVVELARLCSAPGTSWATRVTLRLWREVAAPLWPYWAVRAAVAYSQNARHDGRLYRFDGWDRVRGDAGNVTGVTSTWTKVRAADHPARGPKSLWIWRYPVPPVDEIPTPTSNEET